MALRASFNASDDRPGGCPELREQVREGNCMSGKPVPESTSLTRLDKGVVRVENSGATAQSSWEPDVKERK